MQLSITVLQVVCRNPPTEWITMSLKNLHLH